MYAVQGRPVDIYFANLVRTEYTTGLTFEVKCERGRANSVRWHFEPKKLDVGDHNLRINVLNENGEVIGTQHTLIRVSRADAGEDQNLKLLMIGDSLTHQHVYPARLHKLLSSSGNPNFEMIGSHAPKAYPGVRHEGYAGWSWRYFVERYVEKAYDPAYPQRGSSPFIVKRAGNERKLDIGQYQTVRLGGKRPDIIIIGLGVNDCFSVKVDPLEQIDRCIDKMLESADTLIGALKQRFSAARIAVALTQPPNSRFGAFASKYGEKRSRKDYLLIHHRIVQREISHFGDPEKRAFVFPVGLGLDTVKGFDADNAVHPNNLGYGQMAESAYAMLKAEFTRRAD